MIIRRLAIKHRLLFVFLFFVLFRFYFKGNVATQKMAFFSFLVGYFLMNLNIVSGAFNKLSKRVKTPILFFLLFYSFYFLIVFITPILHQTYDFGYYARFFYFTILILAGVDVFIFINKNIKVENSYKVYVNTFIRVTVFYIFFSYLFLIFPFIKNIWLSLIYQEISHEELTQVGIYITRWGISGFSGYAFTIICTFALILQIMKINETKINLKEFFILLMLFSGNILYGRIGIVASVFCLVTWILYSTVISGKIRVFIYFVVMLALTVSVIVYWYFTSTTLATTLSWAVTPFVNLVTTGEMHNYSANVLMHDMYFMPSSSTLIFGDGRYMDNGSYYMHTDAGFMRLMLYSGIISQLFLYGAILFLLYAVYKNYSQVSKRISFLIVMLFLGSFLVFEFKGEMFFQLISVIFPLALSNMKKLKV